MLLEKHSGSALLRAAYRTHQFRELDAAEFDTAAYSRMKFGSGADARAIGVEMAEHFAQFHWPVISAERCVVVPAPSTCVPVAATLMGWHFRNRLNSMLDTAGYNILDWDVVHRAITYNDNYSELPLEQRRKLLENDERHVNVSFLADKTLILVDDVRITGTHERQMDIMLDKLGLRNLVIYAVYAEYTGTFPAVEHDLNHSCVKDGLCVLELSKSPEWVVTTRALRLLLELPEELFRLVLRQMEPLRLEQVYHAAISKGYSRHEPYYANFYNLRAKLQQIRASARFGSA